MADLSSITTPNNTTYNLKDASARSRLDTVESQIAGLAGYTKFLGVTTTALTDGATTNPITIGGASVTAESGNIATYGSAEFIFNGTSWQAFGDLSGLGSLAFKSSASGSFTPSGTVSQPTFTGTSMTSTGSFTPTGSVGIGTQEEKYTVSPAASGTATYTPAGSVSQPTFTGSSTTSTGSYTPEGTVSVSTNATTNKTATVSPASSGTATYTPAGTISAPTFTGSSTTLTGTYKPEGTVTPLLYVDPDEAPMAYTPEGTVSAPTISVKTAGSTTTIKNPTSQTVAKTVATAAPGATAPSNAITYFAVSGENLKLYQIGYTTGASITTSNVTVKNGDAAYEASTPTFTGTRAGFGASFSGSSKSVSVSGTPNGSVSAPTFTGTGVRLVTGNIAVPNTYTASFTGTAKNVSVSGEPSGTVSKPTFTGTGVRLETDTIETIDTTAVAFHGSAGSVSVSGTPSGTVSQPTFTGTAGTVTVS